MNTREILTDLEFKLMQPRCKSVVNYWHGWEKALQTYCTMPDEDRKRFYKDWQKGTLQWLNFKQFDNVSVVINNLNVMHYYFRENPFGLTDAINTFGLELKSIFVKKTDKWGVVSRISGT